MALISTANFVAFCDRIAAAYRVLKAQLGSRNDTPAAGTVRGTIDGLLTQVVTLTDYQQEIDLLEPCNTALTKATVESCGAYLKPLMDALAAHVQTRGSSVAAALVDISTFLSYYNGGAGGAKFNAMVTPNFAVAFLALNSVALPVAGVMSPALQPDFDSTITNGMGVKDVAGTFTAGTAVNTTLYSEVVPVIEVATTFVDGTAPPTVTITGVDDLGAACTYGPVALAGNNPVAALAGRTITPAVTVAARQTVAFSSATGIIPGSVLKINSGLPDEETIIVEAVATNNVTAVFNKAHNAGAAVSGWTSTAAGNASTGAARRLRSISAITLGLTDHTAGKVRIAGRQDRMEV